MPGPLRCWAQEMLDFIPSVPSSNRVTRIKAEAARLILDGDPPQAQIDVIRDLELALSALEDIV